jgi:hypothetical protein
MHVLVIRQQCVCLVSEKVVVPDTENCHNHWNLRMRHELSEHAKATSFHSITLDSRGVWAKCTSAACAPIKSFSKLLNPSARAIGSPIADHSEYRPPTHYTEQQTIIKSSYCGTGVSTAYIPELEHVGLVDAKLGDLSL